MSTRRRFLALAASGLATPALAQVDLRLPGGPSQRPLTTAFPQKRAMILQRETPPLLETPLDVFDRGVFTPNERFFVRWHYPIPDSIDPQAHRLAITGHVGKSLSLSLADLTRLPRFEIAAVNQCAGNSRGKFEPRIPGAQWGHGAMGNALWQGVCLRDVLDFAGVKPGAQVVRFGGLDAPPTEGAPAFEKSLTIDHARNGEVMLAWAMNGEALPLLNGFPLRLVVPGWYSTYWVKMLSRIEVLDRPDDGYWMTKAYLAPVGGHVAPGTKDFAKAPVTAMVPRSFITSIADGAKLPWREALPVGGIAMGGDQAVKAVEVSADGGQSWQAATLGQDSGRYGFRRFDAVVKAPLGPATLLSRCTNAAGAVQPLEANWNPGGYYRGVTEAVQVELV